MFGRKKSAPITGKIDTLISKAAQVQGDVEFSGGLHLDGRVTGNVRSLGTEPATLWISEQGTVEGSVQVPSVVINGTVIGGGHSSDFLELQTRARVTGDVEYSTIEIHLGAVIQGRLVHQGAAAKAVELKLAASN